MTAHHHENDGASPFPTAQADANRVDDLKPSESMGMPAFPPQSKTSPPDAEHATVTHYAYDPQTYEILCRPGQHLTQKKAQRLQELQLYEHVVSSAD